MNAYARSTVSAASMSLTQAWLDLLSLEPPRGATREQQETYYASRGAVLDCILRAERMLQSAIELDLMTEMEAPPESGERTAR